MRKIRTRLTLYFSIALLSLALLSAVFFTVLFSHHNLENSKNHLKEQALQIASALTSGPVENFSLSQDAEIPPASVSSQGKGVGREREKSFANRGYKYYFHFLDSLMPDNYWIVDNNLQQVYLLSDQSNISVRPLPEGAEDLAVAALSGETTLSESFGVFFGQPGLTVATPLKDSAGNIQGALVLYEDLANIQELRQNALLILLGSTAVAILLAVLISSLLANHFTKPLRRMEVIAGQISQGQYHVISGIKRSDELGTLAAAIDEMAARLNEAKQERERQEQQRRIFLANISHELRTPVTVIRGSLEALRDGVVTRKEDVVDYHVQILEESKYLERLINDLLELSRLQNPDFNLNLSTLNFIDVVRDSLRSAKRLAEPKSVIIESEFAESIIPFTGDYGRLRQMLLIVLDNAVKFSPAGERISVQLTASSEAVQLSIEDRGPGMSAEEKARIFDRFQRQTSEQNKEGTGLGLAIATEIAQRHGIKILVESTLGVGSRFVFCIPTK